MGNLVYPNKACFQNMSNKIRVLTFSNMDQTFKKSAKDGLLNIQSFNECINSLFSDEKIPQLAYTHLADRLFSLLDIQQNGTVDFDAFSKGICMILSGSDMRMKSNSFHMTDVVLFEAIKLKQGKNYLDYDEVFEFYLNSWVYSFNYIYKFINHFFRQEFIQNNIPLPSNQSDFVGLISQQKETLHSVLVQSLHDAGINYTQAISFEQFIVWASKDNTLEINYGSKWFRFAMNVSHLEVIGLNIAK